MTIKSIVVEGNHIGRTIGFPTANLEIAEDIDIADFGVYCVEITLGNKIYQGMANIGPKPTIDDNNALLEVHIFDFERNIVGKEIQVDTIGKIRDINKFESINELKTQLNKDRKICKTLFRD